MFVFKNKPCAVPSCTRHARRGEKAESSRRRLACHSLSRHVTPSAGTSWIPACHVSEQSEMHFQVLRDLPTEERKPLPWGGEADRHTHYKQVKRMVCSAWSELGTNQKQDPIMMPGEMWNDHTSIAMAPGNQVWAKGGASLICIKMKGPGFRYNALLVAKIWN